MSYTKQAVTRLTLDMGLPDVQKSVSVTRGDTNRRLEVTLIDKGSPFALPPDWTAVLAGVLPGGDELYESCIVDDGRIIFDFVAAPAVSSEEGVFGVSFDVFDEGGEVVASPKLWVHVTPGARRLRDPDTVDRLTALQEFIGQINRVNSELAAHTEKIHDAEEALGTHGERLSGLEDKITATGHITVPATEWTDTNPHDAFLQIPGDSFTNGGLLLIAPKDDATREACARARISVNLKFIVDNDPPFPDYVWFLRAESGEIPDSPLHFVYFGIRTGAEDQEAVAAIIGVDAYGEGGGTTSGVDETAVKAIITAMLGNVDNVKQYSADNPPPYPVTSVNGKTGAVSLTIPSKASDVGADPAGTASSKLITHNVDTESHQDLRLELQRLADRLAAVLDSDDTTLDELSEIVAYIKSNKALIDAITTDKVSVADIIDNLTTNVANKPLSAAQGVALKALIDGLQSEKLSATDLTSAINTALAQAKASGEFDGKSAYAYAKDGGYAGTEEEFAKKLAEENPTMGDFNQLSEQVSDLEISKVEHSDLESEVVAQLDGAKADIVTELIAQIGGLPVFGTVNNDKSITVTSTLENGVYTIMYENEDGSVSEIGTITVDSNTVSYINLVPTSIDTDGSVFNGTGYQNGAYLSSSSGKPSARDGYVATGYIEVGSEWYMKGATWTADNYNRVMWVNDSFEVMSYVTASNTSGTVTVTDVGNGVTKFTESPSYNPIKGRKYIRMSLTGTGENLIISATPIE